jgi:hypothetical protein
LSLSHTDSSTDAILAKLAAMQATLDSQQAAIVALQEENARLHAALNADSVTLHVAASDETHGEAHSEASEATGDADAQPRRSGLTSRRSLLRGAAAATAAASVGAVALGAAQPAHAAPLADGSALIIGQVNTETTGTTVQNTTSTVTAALAATTVATDIHSGAVYGYSLSGASGVIGMDQYNGVGVYGFTYGANGTGIKGETMSSGVGVWGEQVGSPGGGTAVYGTAADGVGVWGHSGTGWGVVGESVRGYDFVANYGIIGVQVQGSVGAPTTGAFYIGDCIRDAHGELWLCTAGDGTTLGTWVRVAHLAPEATSGGAISYLLKPVRLLDTRPNQPAANNPGSPYLASSTHTIQVAGVSYGAPIPATCYGAIGNLTVIGRSGQGNYVELVPSGVGFSGTSNLNFAAGQLVSNAYNVGLNGGKLDIILGSGGSADVILDVFAVIS